MSKKPTTRQRKILDFIREQIIQHTAPPTIREIGQRFNIKSTNGVRTHLNALEKKGLIRRQAYRSRGIELTERALTVASFIAVPILGRVAAGKPIFAEEELEGRIGIDRELLAGEGLFALRVRGDSMIDAGIFDGDLVFARQQASADKGEIVVAIIGDEATVKYYHPENGRVRLEPANSAYAPIIISRNTPGFSIAGKVVGVFRKY